MTDAAWEDFVGRVVDRFSVIERRSEPLEDGPGMCEWVTFEGPLGTLRIERIKHPKVTGTHGLGSNRIGGDVAVQYEYDEDEEINTVSVYKKIGDTWQEISLDTMVPS